MLDEIDSLVGIELSQIRSIIQDSAQSNSGIIPKVILNLIGTGGKNIRPKLAILASRIFGYQGDKNLYIASAVELVHNATLLHDDVIDEGEVRRGVSTANKIWGNKTSILVGDLLLSQALQHMAKARSLQALEILAKAAGTISSGEIKQLEYSSNIEITIEQYIEITTAKTAALFSAACEMGAVIAAAAAAQQEALGNYGLNLGIAFQIIDDVLDYSGSEKQTGKKIGNDFYNQKITIPVIMALQEANQEKKEFWRRATEKKQNLNNSDLQLALKYLQNHHAIQKSISIATEYAGRAKENLRNLPDNKYRKALLNILNFVITRTS
jgi:octaprenyl-diphosphate synthase